MLLEEKKALVSLLIFYQDSKKSTLCTYLDRAIVTYIITLYFENGPEISADVKQQPIKMVVTAIPLWLGFAICCHYLSTALMFKLFKKILFHTAGSKIPQKHFSICSYCLVLSIIKSGSCNEETFSVVTPFFWKMPATKGIFHKLAL